MGLRWVFAGVALLAALAGTALWLANRSAPAVAARSDIAPAALYGASFADTSGRPQSLGQFQGMIVVVNFWATWCAPCREEMPGFVRLQDRWGSRGVQFVGLANDAPDKVAKFGRELAVNYPLWVGGDEVGELARRLGDRLGVLPFSALIDGQGRVLEVRVGTYPEGVLENRLRSLTDKGA